MKHFFISILALLVFGSAFSQIKSFNDLLPQVKKDKHLTIGKTAPPQVNPEGLGGPDMSKVNLQKVALVVLNVGPEGLDGQISEVAGHAFGKAFYDESIGVLKESFKTRGIELITYDEMSAEQKAVMNDKDGESWLPKRDPKEFEKLQEGLTKDQDKAITAPMDAVTFNWYNDRQPRTYQLFSYIVDDLDVDAILMITYQIDLGKKVLFKQMEMTMIGPNPIPKVEGKKYPGMSHSDGHEYNYARLWTKEGVNIGDYKLKWSSITIKDLKLNLEGYSDVIKVIMDKWWVEYDRKVQVCIDLHEKNKK